MTLAELLVVTIIVGLLMAIAIPKFLGARDKTYIGAARAEAVALVSTLQSALLDVKTFGPDGATISITGNYPNQTLVISPSAPGAVDVTAQIRMRSSLAAGRDNNVATSPTTFCVAVSNNGRVVYQNGQGTVSSCGTGATLIQGAASTKSSGTKFSSVPVFLESSGLTNDNDQWAEAAFGSAGWVTVSATGKYATYVDEELNKIWSVGGTISGAPALHAVAYGANKYVAVGSNAASTKLYTSTNGTAWTERSVLPSATWSSVIWTGTRFIAVGHGAASAWSKDGINWTTTGDGSGSGTWDRLAYGNSIVVAVQDGSTNELSYSTNGGATWNTAILPSTQDWSDVAFGNGKFMLIARNATSEALTSTNGADWTANAGTPTGIAFSALNYSTGAWAIVVDGDKTFYYSTNGVTWKTHTMGVDRAAQNWLGLAVSAGVWILTSADGPTAVGVS